MNRLLLCLLLLFLTVSAYAQTSTSIEVITKDGRTVILKPDGTWEFEKVAAEPSPNATVGQAKPNMPTDSLPLNFVGHDAKTLYTQLLDLKKRLVKNEFETTAQYEKRIAEEIQKPILDNLTVKDTFSFVVSNVYAAYNADAQKMRFLLPVQKSEMAELYRKSNIYSRNNKYDGDLSRSNLYSIRWETGGYSMPSRQGVFFDETGHLIVTGRDYSPGFSVEVPLDVEKAKRLKNTTKAVIVAKLEEPYAGTLTNLYGIQLQVRIVDIYFFDPQTGKILAKMSEVKKESL